MRGCVKSRWDVKECLGSVERDEGVVGGAAGEATPDTPISVGFSEDKEASG